MAAVIEDTLAMAYQINFSRPTLDDIRHTSRIPEELAAKAERTKTSDARCQEVFDAIELGLTRADAVEEKTITSKHRLCKETHFSDGSTMFETRDQKSGKLVSAYYVNQDAKFLLSTTAKGPDLDAVASGGWMSKLALWVADDDVLDATRDFPGMKASGIVYSKETSPGVGHRETVKLGGSRVLEDKISTWNGSCIDERTEYLGSVIPEHEQKRQSALAQEWLLR